MSDAGALHRDLSRVFVLSEVAKNVFPENSNTNKLLECAQQIIAAQNELQQQVQECNSIIQKQKTSGGDGDIDGEGEGTGHSVEDVRKRVIYVSLAILKFILVSAWAGRSEDLDWKRVPYMWLLFVFVVAVFGGFSLLTPSQVQTLFVSTTVQMLGTYWIVTQQGAKRWIYGLSATALIFEVILI